MHQKPKPRRPANRRNSSKRRSQAFTNVGGNILAEKRCTEKRCSAEVVKRNLPSILLSPVNSTNRAPYFAIVNVKLSDELANVEWVQQVRDICNLSASVPAAADERMREPICLVPFLWLGDVGCARDKEALNNCGITAIVNVAGADFQSIKYPSNWDCLQVDLCSEFESAYHQKGTLLGDHLQHIFVFMQRCVDSGRKIFVHCMTGKSRSVAVCTAFLMLWFKWSLPKALSHVLQRRQCLFDSEDLQEELVALAKVNDLLVADEEVSNRLQKAEAPAAHIWSLASGSSPRASPAIRNRASIVEAMLSQIDCNDQIDGCAESSPSIRDEVVAELDSDLAALEDRQTGTIVYDRFKSWFMVGTAKAG